MFLGGLKEKSIVRKIQKDVEKRNFSLSRKRISTVAILQVEEAVFDSKQLRVLANQLGIDEQAITQLTYVTKIAKERKEDEHLVTDKHLGWKGVLKPKHLKDFVQKKFDLLVNYHETDILALRTLAAASQAQLKVGIVVDKLGLNDLVIHTKTGEEAVFNRELNTYLNILKVNE